MFAGKFWKGIASGTAEKWVDRILSPALVFWGLGVLAYAARFGWDTVEAFLSGLNEANAILLAIGGLLLVAGSAKGIETGQASALRLLEGYWPPSARLLANRRVRRARRRREKLLAEWADLARRYDALSPEQQRQYVRLDATLANDYPLPDRLLPMHLGNRLRAAEDYASRRYGLATSIVWPRLWLVMPDGARAELSAARDRLNAAARFVTWSLLLLVWLVLGAWWVMLLAPLGIVWGYWQALEAAGIYGALLRAAFDVHRKALYEATGWPIEHEQEKARGKALTSYLWRGE